MSLGTSELARIPPLGGFLLLAQGVFAGTRRLLLLPIIIIIIIIIIFFFFFFLIHINIRLISL